MPIECNTCADLRLERNGGWRPFRAFIVFATGPSRAGITKAEFDLAVTSCPNGGCKLLLRVLETLFPDTLNEVTSLMPKDFRDGSLDGEFVVNRGSERSVVQIYVTDCERHPTRPAIVRSACPQNLASDESLQFVRTHLETCTRDHVSCQPNPDSRDFMPKRVLDIGVVDDTQLPVTQRAPIRLVESDSITDGRVYVCLSHRWSASGLTLATTQRNYEKHMEGIPLQDLGTVFMDTVHILRRLSVRYLWIDSLCIIQDQGGDWASESTMMAKIYSGAWFTLARQCGASSEISIQDLKARSHKLTNLATPAVFAHVSIPHIYDQSTRHQEVDFPLKSRGWVYQERLLSRRVVHFTDREISWECGEAEICQCGWVKRKAHDLYSPKRNHTKALGIGNDVYQPDAHGIRQRWRRMVSEFSPLQLTHISDRLPAIQGCVEQIKEKIRDAYIFGLWRGSLLDDLLWSVHMQTELEQRPPGLWHLPTWSWASVEGGVGYDPVAEAQATIVLPADDDDANASSTSPQLIITGRAIPARLIVGKRQQDDRRSKANQVWTIKTSQQTSIEIEDKHVRGTRTVTRSLFNHDFRQDFKLSTHESSESASEYDIQLVQVARIEQDGNGSACLAIWREGKMGSGSSSRLETKDGHPICQRIGLLRTYESVYRVHDEPVIDWMQASVRTISVE